MSFLKKHWGNIAGVIVPILVFVEPSLHAYVQANPKTTLGIIIAALLAAFNSTAPKDANVKS
jgi:hypothetical protein